MASKLALIPQIPLRYEYPAFQEFARRIEKRLDEIELLGTAVATTSGTSIDITGIPSWVTRIDINFVGVSTNGTANLLVQIGDAGGIEGSNYLGAAATLTDADVIRAANQTAGFGVTGALVAASVLHGTMTLTLMSASSNTWVASMSGGYSNTATGHCGGGSKSLSGALTQFRLIPTNGTDAFDAGSMNIRMT